MKRFLMKVAKARSRSPEELRERAAQWGAAHLEALGMRDRDPLAPRALLAACRRSVAAAGIDALVDSVLYRVRPRTIPMFEGEAEARAWFLADGRALTDDVLRRAGEVLGGTYPVLGFPAVRGSPYPDWHRDPVLNVRAPDRHWSRIDYLDPSVVGDHKLVWELSRHQFILTLAQAWWLTRDPRYARRALELLADWIEANPPKSGVNWASSLEVAYRSIAWLWILRLVRGAPDIERGLVARILAVLAVAGRHLERYLSTWFSANTHLTGEALGLLYLGTHLPEFEAAERWRRTGWAILVAQLERQVRPDGTYFEQATYYHRYTLDIYLHARLHATGFAAPDVARMDDAIGRLATVLQWVARPDGSIPLFGDDDGGRLLFLGAAPGDDVRPSLALAAAHLDRPALVAGTTRDLSDVAWILGAREARRVASAEVQAPDVMARAFPDGGLYVSRSGWGPDDSVLTLEAGPHGAGNSGHAHADALSIDLAVARNAVFVDPGTVSYPVAADRQHFRASQVHNTVSLDEQSSAVPDGPFSWRTMTDGTVHDWASGPGVTWLRASHDGYRRLRHGARHLREVLDVHGGWWIVRDTIESAGEHWATASFQCAAGLEARLVQADTVRVLRDGIPLVDVVSSGRGYWEIVPGTASRVYGARTEAPCLKHHFRADGRRAVSFVIARLDRGPVDVAHGRQGARPWIRVRRPDATHLVLFGPGSDLDGVESNAAVTWLGRDTDGVPTTLLAVGGTAVSTDGVPVGLDHGGATWARWVSGQWVTTRLDRFPVPTNGG